MFKALVYAPFTYEDGVVSDVKGNDVYVVDYDVEEPVASLISAAPDLVEALIETLIRRLYESSKEYSTDDENRLKRARENWWTVSTPKELAALIKAGILTENN